MAKLIANDSFVGSSPILLRQEQAPGVYLLDHQVNALSDQSFLLANQPPILTPPLRILIKSYYETDLPLNLILEPEIKQDQVIEFHNIYFGFGSSDVLDSSKFVLDRIINVMNEKPEIEIELSGHTDSKSSDAFNKQLSQKRADNAKLYMISKGIQAERIQAIGMGESRLLNHCKD